MILYFSNREKKNEVFSRIYVLEGVVITIMGIISIMNCDGLGHFEKS